MDATLLTEWMGVRMRRVLAWLAFIGSLIAVGAVAFPTYRVDFMASPVGTAVFSEMHSWFSLLILGYGDPLPLAAGVMVVATAVCALAGVLGRAHPVAQIVLACIALALMILDFIVFGSGLLYGSAGIRGLSLLAPIGMALTALFSIFQVRHIREASTGNE